MIPGGPLELTSPSIASALLSSAEFYHDTARWWCRLFLLMPDHLHALLAFPPDVAMSDVVGEWKGYQSKSLGIRWQGNFFDHRLRNEGEADEKAAYIRRNPVAKGLCATEDEWRWKFSCSE